MCNNWISVVCTEKIWLLKSKVHIEENKRILEETQKIVHKDERIIEELINSSEN